MRYGRQAEREGAAAESIAAIPRVSFFRVNCTLVCDGNRASSKRLGMATATKYPRTRGYQIRRARIRV